MASPARLCAKGYDRTAAGFAEAADAHVYRLLAAPLVRAVKAVVDTATGTVLDVAAGTGAVGRHFPRAVAVDISVEQLRRNRARDRVLADGMHLPFRERSFLAATCAFGVNHVAAPASLVMEMAQLAPVVGVSTWQRPDAPYLPKQTVAAVLARRAGRARTALGELLDRYTDAVGSVDVIAGLLRTAGLAAEVETVEVEIPWPGVGAYLDYRLSMPGNNGTRHDPRLCAELAVALHALPPETLRWRAAVIIGIGRR